MFTLKFRNSKSKNFPIAYKCALKFSMYTTEGDMNIIRMSFREIMNKWGFFNLMFWKSVDWKDTTFGFDVYHFTDHSDKTRIFYAIQEAKLGVMCMSENYIRNIAPTYYNPLLLDKIRDECYNDENINYILDRLSVKRLVKEYEEEFGYLNFETPLRNSDFVGRRLRRELKNTEEE